MAGSEAQHCPSCRAAIDRAPGAVLWCQACEWNLLAGSQAAPAPRGRLAAWRRDAERRLGEKLFTDLQSENASAMPARGRRWSWSLGLAYAFATSVYLASAALGVWGVAILLGPWPSFFWPLGGALLIMFALLARPRFGHPPARLLRRDEYPALYAEADVVADAMHAPRVDGLAVSADFNANYREAGILRRRYVELGLPLMVILTRAEQRALLAHELSHGANGDPLRGRYLFVALATIEAWAYVVRPSSVGRAGEGMHGNDAVDAVGGITSLLMIPVEFVLLGISEVLFSAAAAMHLLIMRESQRAEYLADRLAASVSGKAAMRSMLEKLEYFDTVETVVRRFALSSADGDFSGALRAGVAALPASDRERLQRVSRRLGSSVDSTHPPTAWRIDMLEKFNGPDITTSDNEAVDAELERLMRPMQRQLVDHYLAHIHG